MRVLRHRLVLAVMVLAASVSTARAEGPSAKDKELLAKVSQRLLAVCDPVPGMVWPPDFGFSDKEGPFQAFAGVYRKDGKIYPIVRVGSGMMTKVIQGDPNRLALLLGHELGHILHGHSLRANPGKTPFVQIAFTRAQELQADLTGAELMVKAGYSFRKGKKGFLRIKELFGDRSSFEVMAESDHPSWTDRLAYIDKEQAKL